MRLILKNVKSKLLSVIQSIKYDQNSWEDWMCLRIKTPELELHQDRIQLQFNIGLTLENNLSNTQGSVFFLGFEEILIFGKRTTERFLTDVGVGIINTLIQETKNAAHFKIFDLERDCNFLINDYLLEDFMKYKPDVHLEALSQEEFQYPNFDDFEYPVFEDKKTIPSMHINTKHVLLVEDDPIARWMVRTALKGECLLTTAPDAHRAVVAYQTYRPDVVFLDINLPDGNGIDVLHQIMKQDPGAFIVMFSSHDTMENITHVMEEGARGFVAKPFRKERLMQYIESCPTTH